MGITIGIKLANWHGANGRDGGGVIDMVLTGWDMVMPVMGGASMARSRVRAWLCPARWKGLS